MSKKSVKRMRKRGRLIVRKYVFILAMLVIVSLYIGGQYFFEWEWLTETVATIIAIIAAVAFWLEYHENKLLNEAQFIADLNEQFISNEHMSDVEWDLEKYYNKCRDGKLTEEYCKEFERKYDINKRERQYLINYLVHLEGVAALVKNRVINITSIVDLMSYRYFIAVNNPIVQKTELIKYKDFYHGIFDIYDNWVTEIRKLGEEPPMYNNGENSLTR